MELRNTTEFLEVGCDYITATTTAPRSASSLDAFGGWVVEEEGARGEKVRPWRFSQYHGLTTGSASFGRRPDGGIIRFSSRVADEYWQQAKSLATNVSRLDVQATVVGPRNPTETLNTHLKEVRYASRSRGKKVVFKYHGGPNGLESMDVGSRTSDRYLRIYDKHVQSGLDHYKGAVRYEIEFKNRLAWEQATFLEGVEAYEAWIRKWIFELATVRSLQLVRERWLSPLADGSLTGNSSRSPPRLGRLDKKLSWARFCLRGMVQEFKAVGRLGELLEALGVDQDVVLVQHELWTSRSVHNREEIVS